MGETSQIYRDLQQHIDKSMPVGFPSTESGAEIRILKHLFSPEDAKLALKLGPLPETLEEIHPRVKEIGMTIEELEEKLDSLVMKSIIMGGKLTAGDKGEKRYGLAQWALGMYEFQVDRLTKGLAEEAQQYQNEAYYKEWFKPDTPAQMRTIPIGRSIPAEHHVSTYDSIRSLIENAKGPISVHNCVCKQNMDLLDHPCKLTGDQRTCNTFGTLAEVLLDAGLGREVAKEEMLDLLKKYEDIGF